MLIFSCEGKDMQRQPLVALAVAATKPQDVVVTFIWDVVVATCCERHPFKQINAAIDGPHLEREALLRCST